MSRLALTLLLCAAHPLGATPAWADDARTLSAAAGKSTIKFILVHKAHTVVGTAQKDIEAKAKLQHGKAQLSVRVPVAAFDSGNNSRDAHMKQALETAKFPVVELTAVVDHVTPGQMSEASLKGKLSFHGVTNPIEVPIKIAWSSEQAAHVTAKFSISLEAYKIERPSLLFVKVEDKIDLDVDLQLE